MDLQEMAKNVTNSWSLQEQIADGILGQVQSAEGDTVTFPKDGMESFCKAVSVTAKETFEFIDALRLAEEQQDLISRDDAAKIIQETLKKAEQLSELPVEYIMSIGKFDEFKKYYAKKQQ